MIIRIIKKYWVLLLGLLIFSLFGSFVAAGLFQNVDFAVKNFIELHRVDFLTNIAEAISFLGEKTLVIFLFFILLVFLWTKRHRLEAVLAILVFVAGIIATQSEKWYFQIARPTGSLVEIDGASFPSGHASSFALLAGIAVIALWSFIHQKWQKNVLVFVAVLLSILVAISRVYLGAHWTSDVIGGLMLSGLWVFVFWIVKKERRIV
jgi:undecaprenyl-diphosphatase